MRQHVFVDGIHSGQRLPRRLGIRHTDAKLFLQRNHEFQRIDRIQPETAGTEKRQIVSDLVFRDLQH